MLLFVNGANRLVEALVAKEELSDVMLVGIGRTGPLGDEFLGKLAGKT